jgi:hypothetical protein
MCSRSRALSRPPSANSRLRSGPRLSAQSRPRAGRAQNNPGSRSAGSFGAASFHSRSSSPASAGGALRLAGSGCVGPDLGSPRFLRRRSTVLPPARTATGGVDRPHPRRRRPHRGRSPRTPALHSGRLKAGREGGRIHKGRPAASEGPGRARSDAGEDRLTPPLSGSQRRVISPLRSSDTASGRQPFAPPASSTAGSTTADIRSRPGRSKAGCTFSVSPR